MARPAYDAVARAALADRPVGSYAVRDRMDNARRPQGTQPANLIAWHLGVGATLVAMMAIRVIWRLTHSPMPSQPSALVSVVLRITHVLLYAALVWVPLLGWINASSRGWSVSLLGSAPYPALSEPGSAFGEETGDLHGILAWVLRALAGLHVGAALFHRFVLKDHVL